MTTTKPLTTTYLNVRVMGAAAAWMPAGEVLNGDILTCPDRCCAQLVMGSSTESGTARLLVVREDQTWEDRQARYFGTDRRLYVVREA